MNRNMLVALGLIGLVAGHAVGAGAGPTTITSSGGARLVLAQDSPHQTEARLQTVIEEMERGNPDLSRMEPALQQAMRQQMPMATTVFRQLGSMQKIVFVENQNGTDIYKVVFQNGTTLWAIRLADSGKIAGLSFHPYREQTR
jgi:hypothetical protein